MRLRFILASCLVLPLFAACGDDGGGSDTPDASNNGGVDAPNTTVDAPVVQPDSPTVSVNCDPLDLANAPEVTIVSNQMITPNPQAGTVVAGTYELTSAKLYAFGLQVTGTAQARVEIVPGDATAGAARLAVVLDGMALGQPFDQELTGAGQYTIAGNNLTVADGCGGSEPLPVLQYTATSTALTLWTTYNYMNLNIPIELGLALEQ